MVDKPIFIFACGGRTGSTFLQRALISTGEVLVWGETNLLHLLETYPKIHQWTLPKGINPGANDLHLFRKEKENMWTSNLFPEQEILKDGLKVFFNQTLAKAALKEGYPRWGFKEVTWRAQDVYLVKHFWPKAKIIFLTRKFEEAYSSAAKMGWLWNEERCHNFIDEWLRMTEVHLAFRSNPDHLTVKYERLDYTTLKMVAQWCELPPPKNNIAKIGSGTGTLSEMHVAVCQERKLLLLRRYDELGYEYGRL